MCNMAESLDFGPRLGFVLLFEKLRLELCLGLGLGLVITTITALNSTT